MRELLNKFYRNLHKPSNPQTLKPSNINMSPEKTKLMTDSFNRSETLKFYQAELLEINTDFVSIKIPKMELMTRKAGMFNGAMIASLVDVSSGYAAVSHYEEDCYVVTVELKVNYLRPAIGDALVSKSYVVKGGSKISVIRTEIYTVDENRTSESHVATSLVTMMKIK
ncbi:uncharacterized protein (TIGR00369 family) [Chryseobacterium sp. BIGb0186]|nr:uncharacterized protein (TIGR00369 family) [Chryseobacterium sp. BIGb0186]